MMNLSQCVLPKIPAYSSGNLCTNIGRQYTVLFEVADGDFLASNIPIAQSLILPITKAVRRGNNVNLICENGQKITTIWDTKEMASVFRNSAPKNVVLTYD